MVKIFSTKSGNRYGYDSLTGKIITVHSSTNKNEEIVSDDELIEQMVDENIVGKGHPQKIRWLFSFDEYIRQLEHEIPSMVVELTDACNLKCRYCNVSGEACDNKSGHHYMREDTLIKCLDFFIEHNSDAKDSHIGFYGGEALLQFSLIKKSVDYVNRNVPNKVPTFDISTNGLLLTDEVAKWLSEHSTVQITCTVNGPYHDKYRKTVGGNGSLNTIVRNLHHIKDSYPSVWDNQIRFIANTDTDEEIPELLDFYDSELGKLPGLITKIHWKSGACPLSRKQNEDVLVDFSTESPIREYYAHTVSSVKRRKRSNSTDDAIIGSCFPCGVKMFVHTYGQFSFCEQANYHYSIGDVETGFNVQYLRNLYEDSEKLFSQKCRCCWAQKMCDVCLAALISRDGNLISEIPNSICEQAKTSIERKLRLFCQLAEEAPDLIDKI